MARRNPVAPPVPGSHSQVQGNTELHPGLLKELLNELDGVKHKWRNVGIQLGIQHHELEVISGDRSRIDDCFAAMLDMWLHRTEKNQSEIWVTVCEVLMKLQERKLANAIARKRGIIPKIVEQPQDQRTVLGDTVTFRCTASTSGPQITFKWLHPPDGRYSEVKVKPASSELSIKEVTEGDRRIKYGCIVKNEFGEEKSQLAELIIGNELSTDTLRGILNEEGIKDTDWPEIGECLGQADLRSTFVGGILIRIQECPSDKTDLWHKIAQTLEGMEAAAQKAENNAGKQLNESSVSELFKKARIQNPDWCKIDKKLRNTEHAHKGSESCSVATILEPKNITAWEDLAKALEGIKGYEFAAEIIKTDYTEAKITRDKLEPVFRGASRVNWHLVVEKFPSFNKSCLIEVLTIWLSQQKGKDPWMYWRKLAASVESLKEGSEDPKEVKCQLGIGYKLRLRFGVGLELNGANLNKVVTDAGIKDKDNWKIIVSGLKLDPSWTQLFLNLFRKSETIYGKIIQEWPEPQSWEELARVINDSKDLKHGPEIAQKTRQLSGSGGFPIINVLYTDPELKNNQVTSKMDVTLKCKARGAPPLKYTWTCDGEGLRLPDSRTVQLKVHGSGQYNCRVENEFGSCTSNDPLQLVHGEAPTCKFDDQQKRNIQTGHKLHLYCTAGGSEPLTYKWLHDGVELPAYSGPDLVIEHVKPDAAGKYECRVDNDFGKDSTSIKIKVGEPPQIISVGFEGPERVHYEKDITLKFYCKATGASTYTWRRFKGSLVTVGHHESLVVVTAQETEGQYTCQVKNDFGDITSSPPIEIKVGVKPTVKAPPKIAGEALPGERVQLTCAVEGNGPFEYFWIQDNQTLVKEARSCWTEAELCIEEMTAADQGEYKCRFINPYGFDVSKSVPLHLGIDLKELMKQLCAAMSHRWYMFGILLDVKKPILVRISRGFVASRDVKYSLQEVIVSWLEMKHNPQRPHSWATIQDVVQRMGNEFEALARDLDSLTETESLTQKKTEEFDAKDMHIRFETLAGKVENMLTISDSSNTESGSTRRNTDAVVSGIRAYLHLITFKDEHIQEMTDLASVIKILRQYLNYQRYHLLEKVIFQFGSKKAQSEMKEEFIDTFSKYQATTLLGAFVLSLKRDPPNSAVKNPPFACSLKIMLESKWATCTLRDVENLLVNLLPDTVGREFVWFSTAYPAAEDTLVCLEYLVLPTVIELLRKEMKMRKQTLRSMGIHCVQVDSFKTEASITTEEQEANPKFKTEIEALRTALEDTSNKQDSEIKALRTALEDKSTMLDSEIEAQRTDLKDTSTEIEALRTAVDDTRTKQDSLRTALEDTSTKQDSEIKALRTDHEDTNTKKDSEIEALKTALEDTRTDLKDTRTNLEDTRAVLEETRTALEDARTVLETALEDAKNAHDQEIKALQQNIDALKKSTTAVHQRDKGLLDAQIKTINKTIGEIEEKLTDHAASLENTKIRHGIRKQSKQSLTKPLHDSVLEKTPPRSTGEQIGENAEKDHRSQEQGQSQEFQPLDAASILKEIREAQQRMESTVREVSQRMESTVREESQRTESRMREELELLAKKFEDRDQTKTGEH